MKKIIISFSITSLLLSSCTASLLSKNQINLEKNYNDIKINQGKNHVTKIEGFDSIENDSSFSYISLNPFQVQNNKIKTNKSPELRIDDIVLFDSNQSIIGENKTPETNIIPDFNGKTIKLKIKGFFKTSPKININNFSFTNEPGLLHQSVTDNEPKFRVVIDESILLTPISVSESEIIVSIETKGIPDLFLGGLHKLTIVGNKYFTDTLISVKPEIKPLSGLYPKITNVEILRDSKNKPINLRISGQNFFLYYKFIYAKINDKFSFGHSTNIIDNDGDLFYESIIHIPNPDTFDNETEHIISYSTPFGTAIKSF